MKIYLYLSNKLLKFTIPKEISGSFSFDENPEEESKLINIEAKDGNWYIYSTNDVSLIADNNILGETILRKNSYYILRRNEKNYLIYTTDTADKNLNPYTYNQDINITVGNDQNCNIKYNCEYYDGIAFNIKYANNRLVLTKTNKVVVYANGTSINTNSYYIKNGDQINVYGLKLVFLPGVILINNPDEQVIINETTSKIHPYFVGNPDNPKNDEIKDVDLYSKDEYFSKPPRLRRIIETKEISLDKPPAEPDKEDKPLLLVLGPMFTMGITSVVTLTTTLNKIYVNEATWESSISSIVMAVTMLISMLLWPSLTNLYTKKKREEKKKEITEKYGKYLEIKKEELENESKLQREILIENLITVEKCLGILKSKNMNLWDKRIDQSDFLVARIGNGDELLDVDVKYPEEGFSIEESELKEQADKLVEDYKYIRSVPMGYSFYENKVTAIMNTENKSKYFMNNIILQLLTFYSYEDLKVVMFTNEENEKDWSYLKYTNHAFSNDKSIRFFATTNEDYKLLAEYFEQEVNYRLSLENKGNIPPKPYYLIIIDDYDRVKRYDFIKTITEVDNNIGYSIVILENKIGNLPSKCNNFINLGANSSGILKNSYEKQEQITFFDEINYTINMMEVARVIGNIPIEFETGMAQLPDSITFLEMEKIGKVKQLNIANRWNTNDATQSLKAEIGVDETGEFMYLDLHEKAHGPHGLVAGMTGSGKSEFIITYILSMVINYSPDDVAFILIDYKGGGLAFAFENKATGMVLPHLAGTITNLDKAEMDRTLVSIDSEVKRRQRMFNEARDKMGESTIDIYKYQRLYKEGKLKEPIPHLFIVCDEFAELKSQQPEFMDNLISIARIGRSLGVHLILATQKPSGVVNDQIWSNAKFHVCLKVQDEGDSNEMLKRPDAANLKQTGRFYLQVGYDEYFALGQSAWAGAKYFPSEKIVKNVDKSINFINDMGLAIKNIQAGSSKKIEAEGEQLAAIMKEVIEVAEQNNKRVPKLWLDNIPEIILVDNLIKKYQLTKTEKIISVIGEYDAPEKQEQGLMTYTPLEDGNTIVYGADGSEYEMLLNTLIYSTAIRYNPEEISYYVMDFGSQSMNKYEKLPHIGGVVNLGETEKYNNLLKLIKEEIAYRKKLFTDYGGEYKTYQLKSENKLPLMMVIMNNFDSINENDKELYDTLPELVRDSERYGIVFVITATSGGSVPRKVSQNFKNIYVLKVKDQSDYNTLFTVKKKLVPRDIKGRGVYQDEEVLHEFQIASIVEEETQLSDYIAEVIKVLKEKYKTRAKRIPVLPEQVELEDVEKAIKSINKVPIGIVKDNLNIAKYDLQTSLITLVSSNKLKNIKTFANSFIEVLKKIPNTTLIVFDGTSEIENVKAFCPNYYNNDFDNSIKSITEFVKSKQKEKQKNIVVAVYGFDKLINKLDSDSIIADLFKELKKYEKSSVILFEQANKIKLYAFEDYYTQNVNVNNGIWIGRGASEESVIKISNYTKELSQDYPNNIAFMIQDGAYKIVKALEFEKMVEEEDE